MDLVYDQDNIFLITSKSKSNHLTDLRSPVAKLKKTEVVYFLT